MRATGAAAAATIGRAEPGAPAGRQVGVEPDALPRPTSSRVVARALTPAHAARRRARCPVGGHPVVLRARPARESGKPPERRDARPVAGLRPRVTVRQPRLAVAMGLRRGLDLREEAGEHGTAASGRPSARR